MSRYFSFKKILSVFCLSGLSVSCSTPEHMQIYEGVAPKNVDRDVVFRNTYYFRVFDYCENKHTFKVPKNEALYRYRMTGKANALANRIRFESGTLKAHEIDPFGATVRYDEKMGSKWVSSEEAQAQSQYQMLSRIQKELFDEFQALAKLGKKNEPALDEQLLKTYQTLINDLLKKRKEAALISSQSIAKTAATSEPDNLWDSSELASLFASISKLEEKKNAYDGDNNEFAKAESEVEAAEDAVEKSQKKYDDKKQQMAKEGENSPEITEGDKQELNEALEKLIEDKDSLNKKRQALRSKKEELQKLLADVGNKIGYGIGKACNPTSMKRGYQILGPEGWRTFDQDERLVLAMHSKATPVISMMKELSGRILKTNNSEANQLILLQEQLNTSNVISQLEQLDISHDAIEKGEAIKSIIDKLEADQ